MELKKIDYNFSVCKVVDYSLVNLHSQFCFIEKTDNENSLVCLTSDVPINATQSEDGWKAFRVQGSLDFSLIGILSKICNILANNNISIFAISTYNTDYVFVKENNFQKSLNILGENGYNVIE